ncbi:hypothetical protein MBLNU13_g08630t1 [Cladosporium sp. NU13]
MANFDLPLRNRKDLVRAAQLRNFAVVGRPFNPRSALPADYDDPYLPVSRRRPDRSLSTPYHNTSLASYNLDQSSDARFSDTYNYRPASYPRRNGADYNNGPRLPFDKAARALHRALDGAFREASRLEQDFNSEMSILPYADERTRAHLWTLKVEYRCWNVDASTPSHIASQVDFFAKYAGILLDAIEDMRHAEHPSMHDWAGGQRGGYEVVTMEDVRFAMKKLGVSFGAVAELLEGVKVEKQRCAVLLKELRSAMDILEGMKETWEVPRNGKGRFRDITDARIPIHIPVPAPSSFSDEYDG